MKKILMIAVMAIAGLTASAKTYYGSEQGGFALTFNANPLLNYVGNMFNGTQNNSLEDFNGLKNKLFSGTTITGKLFIKDNVALDLGFGFDDNYETRYYYKENSGAGYDKERAYETDCSSAFMFKGGFIFNLRPGERIQPSLGIDLVYVHENEYEYNKSTDGTDKGDFNYLGSPVNKFGVMASVGVEYFIIRQISVGATVDFGASRAWNARSYDYEVANTKEDGYRVSSTNTNVLTGNFGGNISLNFYF